MSSTTLPVCPKTGSISPSLTVHLCLHTAPGNRECAPSSCVRNGITDSLSYCVDISSALTPTATA